MYTIRKTEKKCSPILYLCGSLYGK